MSKSRRGIWVGLVGPDGSGKSALVDELRTKLEAEGLDVVHTHGRPQAIARRTLPADADPTTPHARGPRGPVLSLAKYLLASLDFVVARRRLLRHHDVWLCERPLFDYEVDPARYQLDERLLPLLAWCNGLLPRPDDLLLLSGDAEAMAARKPELAVSEIDRQLTAWQDLSQRVKSRSHTLDTTAGSTAAQVASDAADALRARPIALRWRKAPVKPTRLDVRFAGRDIAALDVYRPIRVVARTANAMGRTLARSSLAPRVASPDLAIDALVTELRGEGWRIDGVSAMASSATDRWIVGLADGRQLTHVLKVGPTHDEGLAREVRNLRDLQKTDPFDRLHVPPYQSIHRNDRIVVATVAVQGNLAPVTSVNDAVTAATELASSGWTHGDLAPWNLFSDERGRLILLDWEEAEPSLRPLWDIVHYLLRLGATTHPGEAREALVQLMGGGATFKRLLAACDVDPTPQTVAFRLGAYLSDTEHAVMSPREAQLRTWLANEIVSKSRSSA